MVLVKADIKKHNPDELVQFSIHVEAGMNGNLKFADPSPKLVDINTARLVLEAAIPVAANGDRVAVAKRNSAAHILGAMLSSLCRYVNSASNGDRDVALTSNFPAAKEPTPIPLVAPPFNLTAQPTEKGGEALLRFRTHYGSRTKQIYATTGDPNAATGWELIGVTTKSRFLATNLDSNKTTWFRVNAICSAGVSGYSDPAKCRAAA
ncbi:MAG: hypothetical protein IPP83_15720 [Flavobacteriales bacterium]|nr:hypothetical protein [Flavobacteriales bacterium]